MTFTIDVEDNITVLTSSKKIKEARDGTETFSSPHELLALAAQWPASRMVQIWNSLPGVKPVERFTSRQVASTRIWKGIQNLQPAGAQRRQVASNKPRNKAGRTGRENTKGAKVIALLQQPEGASLRTIMRVTGWQNHSVRGFISGHLNKTLGLKVRSSKRDGERIYSIEN
jgi:hypothetical protein